MKEILIVAKKIRNKLLFFIDEELKKNSLKKNSLLIDSKTPHELAKKYQKFSDYRMQISETYNGNHMNNIDNINFYHVSVTYSSIDNNYQIWIENNEKFNKDSIEKQIEEKIDIKSKKIYDIENNSFNIILKDNKKRNIGEKKFSQKKKALLSSIEIPKKSIIIMEENNNSDNIHKNQNTIDKLDNYKNNDEKNETVCANKKRRFKVNYYENKLKKYCSTLIILKKKKKKIFKKNFTLKQEIKPVIETPCLKKYKDSKDKTETKLLNSIKSQSKQHKSKTREKEKLTKILEKKNHRKFRAQSIKDTHLLVSNLPKKIESPKKIIHQSTTIHADSKNKEIISQKIPRKEKDKNLEEVNDVRKMVSGGVKGKRKMFADKLIFKWNNKMMFQMTNKTNNNEPQQHSKLQTQFQQPSQLSSRRALYKRANTLNKAHNLFHFKGNELKFKEN